MRNIIIVLVILVVGILVYGMFFSSGLEYRTEFGDMFSSLESSDDGEIDGTTLNSNVLAVLRSVENIDLENTVFNKTAFSSLVDKSITLPEISAVGRENIFAPLETTVDTAITPGETVILQAPSEQSPSEIFPYPDPEFGPGAVVEN